MNTIEKKQNISLDLDSFDRLDYRKKAMYKLLSDEQKQIIKDLPTFKHKKRMIAIYGYEILGTNARRKWINGLHHMRQQAHNPDYFFKLLLNIDRAGVEDFIDMYLNYEAGEYNYEKNTDPSVYKLIKRGVYLFKLRGYHEIDYDRFMDYLETNPDKNILNKQKQKIKQTPC